MTDPIRPGGVPEPLAEGGTPWMRNAFPHAEGGKFEGPLHLNPTDLLEVRMDDDKFEQHTPLGTRPTYRRIGEPEE